MSFSFSDMRYLLVHSFKKSTIDSAKVTEHFPLILNEDLFPIDTRLSDAPPTSAGLGTRRRYNCVPPGTALARGP